MPIAVICPSCKAQFRVSDQFAGKTGPCPKCKAKITVPKADEVKIHAPEEFASGGKDSKGRAATKPIPRLETKISTNVAVAIGGGTFTVLLLAFIAGRVVANKALLSAVGLTLVSVPLVVGGYFFLRDDEAEPYNGRMLWLRSALCAAIYAILWGVFYFVPDYWVVEYWSWFYISVPFLIAGATTAFACLDLEFGNGFFHYSFYVIVTMLLRFLIGMPMIWASSP